MRTVSVPLSFDTNNIKLFFNIFLHKTRNDKNNHEMYFLVFRATKKREAILPAFMCVFIYFLAATFFLEPLKNMTANKPAIPRIATTAITPSTL